MNIVQAKIEHRSHRTATAARRNDLTVRLTDLAEAAIAHSGLQHLRARALADAAGCAVGAIYTVFCDLDELILTVNARTLDAIDAALTMAVRGVSAPDAQMAQLAAAYLDYATQHRGCWNALFQHRMAGGVRCRIGMRAVLPPLSPISRRLFAGYSPAWMTWLARNSPAPFSQRFMASSNWDWPAEWCHPKRSPAIYKRWWWLWPADWAVTLSVRVRKLTGYGKRRGGRTDLERCISVLIVPFCGLVHEIALPCSTAHRVGDSRTVRAG